ncbi:hypothetical protein B9J80_00575, partial [Vibrio sp. V12_P9A6T4]
GDFQAKTSHNLKTNNHETSELNTNKIYFGKIKWMLMSSFNRMDSFIFFTMRIKHKFLKVQFFFVNKI